MATLSDTVAPSTFAEANDKEAARQGLAMPAPMPVRARRGMVSTAAWGTASALLYAALFLWQDEILRASTAGGWAFAVPVTIAFTFSTVHGNFTSKLWAAVGLQAKK